MSTIETQFNPINNDIQRIELHDARERLLLMTRRFDQNEPLRFGGGLRIIDIESEPENKCCIIC